MKGPSLEAIRKFKQQQEQKKRQEYDKKIQEKLTILEHRAAQGDKKAKHQLKQIEKVEDDKSRPLERQKSISKSINSGHGNHAPTTEKTRSKSSASRAKRVESNFEELMRLAASNNNEVKCRYSPEQKSTVGEKSRNPLSNNTDSKVKESSLKIARPKQAIAPVKLFDSNFHRSKQTTPSQVLQRHKTQYSNSKDLDSRRGRDAPMNHLREKSRLPVRPSTHRIVEYDNFDDEDDYECDGFVVDEDDDGVQAELDETLRKVFRYDKRRAELREEALDREYRAIGRVSTFEDLEREERRASRLAAAEDARALREEEEHKRLKRLRLKQLRE